MMDHSFYMLLCKSYLCLDAIFRRLLFIYYLTASTFFSIHPSGLMSNARHLPQCAFGFAIVPVEGILGDRGDGAAYGKIYQPIQRVAVAGGGLGNTLLHFDLPN